MIAFAVALVGAPLAAQPPGAPPGGRPGGPRGGRIGPAPPPEEPPPIAGVVAVTVPAESDLLDLSGRFYYFEDASGELTLDDVRAPAFADRFRLAESAGVNLGFTDSALWLRIDIRYVGRRAPDWVLSLEYPLLDRIDVYHASARGDRPWLRLGDRQPFADRVVPRRQFSVPIVGEGPERRRLYLRIETESSMQVRPTLTSGARLFELSVRESVVFGIVYGLMLLMAIYNLFLFLGVRDRSYLLFVGATLCGLLFLMALYGHAFQYLWPTNPTLANLANPLLAALWIALTAAFARAFLEPRQRSPAAARVIDALIALGLVATGVALVARYRPAMMVSSAAAALGALGLMICGAVVWFRGHRAARFFTVAWIGLGVGILLLAASRFGLMPNNDLTRNGALIGGTIEMLLLSLALSDKYRLMHLELRGYSRGLEAMVDQRTRQLAHANEELQRLSITDPLTGVANRRQFDERLAAEVGRHRRIGEPLSLAMIDIDHFKEFNDRHGHPLGDECLRRVAAALAAGAHRASDLVARYGGEEFSVLLPQTDARGAVTILDRLLDAVRGLRFAAAGSEEVGVTVSAGLVTRVPDESDDGSELVAAADRALYEAKRQGRDRRLLADDIG